MKCWSIFLIIAMLSQLWCHAQQNSYTNLGGLNIGDTFEYPVVGKAVNVDGHVLDLSMFRGKLLILDFWSHGCSSCIAAFPKLDSLQQLYADSIQIIAVNSEPMDATLRFLANLKTKKTPSFPLVTGDSLLHSLFPHVYVPHHIWIDQHGKVTYITNGKNTNGHHIREFLSGLRPELSETRRVVQDGLFDSPLLPILTEYEHQYSVLTKAIPGVSIPNQTVRYRDGDFTGIRISRNSASILELFQVAYNEGGKYNFNAPDSWETVGIDRARLVRPRNEDIYDTWYRNFCYNYDLRAPREAAYNLYVYMKEDMRRFFGIEAKLIRRRKSIYVLEVCDKYMFRKTVASQRVDSSVKKDSGVKVRSTRSLVTLLQRYSVRSGDSKIILDDISFEEEFIIDISSLYPFDLIEWNRSLAKYGMRIRNCRRKVPIIRLTRSDRGKQ